MAETIISDFKPGHSWVKSVIGVFGEGTNAQSLVSCKMASGGFF